MNQFNQKKILAVAKCPKCGSKYNGEETSTFHCSNCGYEEPTNFGIVREYLNEHGNASAITISRDTNIPIGEINSFLRNGKLEIPENSDVFIRCKRCGIEIRYGSYCPECAQELAKELQGAFDSTIVGVVPKNLQGKMHSHNLQRQKR